MPSSPWVKPNTSNRPIAVIGGGIMGRRISMMWVAAGYSVILCEKSIESYDASKLGTKPGEIKLTASLEEAASNAWMVIEAVPEKLDMKIDILGQLDKTAPLDCIVTTNSSSLRSSQMLEKTTHNFRICNSHYYMPPEQTYYEVMSCGYTDPAIFPFLMDKAATAGFQPAHAKKDSTGLIFNRIWAAIKRECLLVMADGVSDGRTIDDMFKSWFKADKGPCQMMDTVGLDTVYNIEVVYEQQRGVSPRAKDWLKAAYIDKGNLGAKAGEGLLG
ncbi:Dehydrogenase multihelical [Penicillium argentinense]|uniref:Dehydrogenase multihelical n=1 Tax=Penicillium argentinense TaxID=1131581 RepID=A0A9W9FPU5_9EURO|nr:Dehydrogenase multihelical [Penicillium argentinense]KAJ5104140.1 Dehydrogenase multihelical [Penicillium argentinense]